MRVSVCVYPGCKMCAMLVVAVAVRCVQIRVGMNELRVFMNGVL